jgi:hypothetical protein
MSIVWPSLAVDRGLRLGEGALVRARFGPRPTTTSTFESIMLQGEAGRSGTPVSRAGRVGVLRSDDQTKRKAGCSGDSPA